MMGKDYWKRRLTKLLFGLLAIILSIGSWPPLLKANSNPAKERYIVHLTSQSDPVQWSYKKGFSSQLLKKVDANSRTLVFQLNPDEVRKMQLDSEVTLIEKDYAFQLFADDSQQTISHATYGFETRPSQQFETTPWGITATQAVYAHRKGNAGQGVKIAVLDTGVDSSHPDLRIAGGYSFVEGEETYEDQQGHGTHVTGIINALPNGYGVIGMAPEAEVYALKVMNTSGMGYYSSVIQAIEWCIQNEIQIVSMSFGGMEDSKILHQVIQEAATEHGILFVAAAGNNGAGVETETYPARYSEVLSVGAVNESNQQSSFSSAGNELDIVAPGEQIWSTTVHGEYGVRSETSMATPYVTGAAALIWASDPGLRADQVRAKLLNQALPLGESRQYGAGLVQVGGNQESLELSTSSLSFTPKGKQNSEVRKLLRSFLTLQKKAMEQNKVQLSKDIYAEYNQLKIDFDKFNNYLDKNTDPFSVTKSVYDSSVIKSVYANAMQLPQYIEFQEDSIEQILAKSQGKLNQFSLALDNNMVTKSIAVQSNLSEPYWNVKGNEQTIMAGEVAHLSFESATNLKWANILINGPDYFSGGTVYYEYEIEEGYYPYFDWYTYRTMTPGEYKIQMTCLNSEDYTSYEISFTIYVIQTQHKPIYINTSQHFDIPYGESAGYLYRSGNQFETITVQTEFLEEYDLDSDTMLQVYSDEEKLNQIAFNDDYDGLLSSVTLTLQPHSVIFIKCSGYAGNGVNANIGIYKVPNAFSNIYENLPLDLSYPSLIAGLFSFTPTQTTTYSISTGPYGGTGASNDTLLYLFSSDSTLAFNDDDGVRDSFSKITIELKSGNEYYLAICGDNTTSVRARLMIQMVDLIPPTNPGLLIIKNQTATTATLSWKPSTDNIGVSYYDIYQNSRLIATVNGSTLNYTAVGLISNVLYTFTVKARDTVGNHSGASNSSKYYYLSSTITYLYDVKGRIIGLRLPSGQTIIYSNDANGNTSSIVTP